MSALCGMLVITLAVAWAQQPSQLSLTSCGVKPPLKVPIHTHQVTLTITPALGIDYSNLGIDKDGNLNKAYGPVSGLERQIIDDVHYFDLTKADQLDLYATCVAKGLKLRNDQEITLTVMDAAKKSLFTGKVRATSTGKFLFVRDK
jgi:hypothetical protein